MNGHGCSPCYEGAMNLWWKSVCCFCEETYFLHADKDEVSQFLSSLDEIEGKKPPGRRDENL